MTNKRPDTLRNRAPQRRPSKGDQGEEDRERSERKAKSVASVKSVRGCL